MIVMDFHDFLRSFFGFKSPPGTRNDRDQFYGSEDDDGWHPANMHNQPDGDNFFDIFHGDINRQMKEMHRQMEELMRGFGSMEFHSFYPEGYGESPGMPSRDPRDDMLKEPDSSPSPSAPAQDKSDVVIVPFNQPSPFKFGGFFSPGFPPSAREGDKNDITESPEQRTLQPNTYSYGSSVTIRTVRGAGGKIEEKRTVRDSTGKEETTVTRVLGDQSHTVITKKDKEGVQEKIENYKNMDEKDLSEFDKHWKNKESITSPRQGQGTMIENNVDIMKNDSDINSPLKPAFWKRFFGLD